MKCDRVYAQSQKYATGKKNMLFLYIILFIVGILYIYRRWARSPGGSSLPSPEGKRLIIGHETSHFKLDEWAYKYGEIFEIYSYGKRMIVLNAERLIRKAQSDAYRVNFGGRPKTFYGEHFAHNSQTIAFGCGDTHLAMRKIYNKALHVYGDGVEKFEKIMAQSIKKMLNKIEARGARDFDLYSHVKESLADTMCILVRD